MIHSATGISLQQSFIHLDDTSGLYPEIGVSWQHTSVSFNLLSTVRISKYQVTALVVFSLYPIINRLHDETEDQVQVPEGEDVPGLI